jgi:hypothetical protein
MGADPHAAGGERDGEEEEKEGGAVSERLTLRIKGSEERITLFKWSDDPRGGWIPDSANVETFIGKHLFNELLTGESCDFYLERE